MIFLPGRVLTPRSPGWPTSLAREETSARPVLFACRPGHLCSMINTAINAGHESLDAERESDVEIIQRPEQAPDRGGPAARGHAANAFGPARKKRGTARLTRISHADSPSGGIFFRISASQNPLAPQRVYGHAFVIKGTCFLIFEKIDSPVLAACRHDSSNILSYVHVGACEVRHADKSV